MKNEIKESDDDTNKLIINENKENKIEKIIQLIILKKLF